MSGNVRIKWDTSQAEAALKAGGIEGITNCGEHLLKTSRDQVPIEEGTLERSGTVYVDRSNLRAYVSYGSRGSEAYAVRQHEDLTLRHDSGRNAKYLENPLNSEREVFMQLLAGSYRRRLS